MSRTVTEVSRRAGVSRGYQEAKGDLGCQELSRGCQVLEGVNLHCQDLCSRSREYQASVSESELSRGCQDFKLSRGCHESRVVKRVSRVVKRAGCQEGVKWDDLWESSHNMKSSGHTTASVNGWSHPCLLPDHNTVSCGLVIPRPRPPLVNAHISSAEKNGPRDGSRLAITVKSPPSRARTALLQRIRRYLVEAGLCCLMLVCFTCRRESLIS